MAEENNTPIEQLVSVARDLGYSGQELRTFVENQQRMERDERAERRRIAAEIAEQERLKETQETERLRISGEQETKRLEQETLKAQADQETERLRIQLELERLKIQRETTDDGSSVSSNPVRSYAPRPKLPKFSEGSDSIDAYISRFETFASSQGWPAEEWAVILSALLTGKALQIFTALPAEQQSDFDAVKESLMKGFDLTEEGFRKKFRSARLQAGETYTQGVYPMST